MTNLYRPLLAELGLTYPQYLVMLVLWEQDGLGIGAIAEKLHQDSGSVTPLVKRLERLGYLSRERSSLDERALRIVLTQPGRELRGAAAKVTAQVTHACNIGQADLDELMSRIGVLARTLAGGSDSASIPQSGRCEVS
ncbi:MarR family winged helix-turn-helix transcriptional regulator [Massilia polaris]|nr:MarR family transcriptional regulator [Massilia polaris]